MSSRLRGWPKRKEQNATLGGGVGRVGDAEGFLSRFVGEPLDFHRRSCYTSYSDMAAYAELDDGVLCRIESA